MTFVKSLGEAEERMLSLVGGAGRETAIIGGAGRETAIIGGHFPVENDYRPGVAEDDTFGIFPQYTWDLACKMVQKAKSAGRKIGLALVVDDHVLMTPQDWWSEGQKDNPQAQSVRFGIGRFFEGFQMSQRYREIMEARGVNEGDLIRATADVLPFQESRYRQEFESAHPGMPIGCAGEYELILKDLASRGYQRIIGMIPERCLGPTCNAVTNYGARRKLTGGLPKIEVMHLYLPTSSEVDSVEALAELVARTGMQFRR